MLTEPESHVTDKWALYTTPDEEAPEWEVTDLIASFVSALKPKTVVETGTARGHTSEAIGWQLEANGNDGVLHTFEVDAQKAHDARERTRGLPVVVHTKPARDVVVRQYEPVDLIFIDAVLEERAEEYLHWRPALIDNGIAIIHDTMKFQKPLRDVSWMLNEHCYDQALWLPTPRGVTIIQKNG